MTDQLKVSLMKLTLITPEPLNLKEENISDVTDDLTEDHVLKMNSEHDSEDLSFSLFEWVAEISKTDSECLTAKRVWIEGKAYYEGVSLQICSLKEDVLYHKDQLWVSADD